MTSAKTFKENLVLRGLIHSAGCGQKMTGSTSISRNCDKHDYYHCNHCREVRVKATTVHQRVEAILSEFQFKGEAKKLFTLMMKKLTSDGEKKKRPLAKIKEELEMYEKRLLRMEDDYADGKMEAETFSAMRSRYNQEISKLQKELRDNSSQESDFARYLKSGINVLEQLPQFYDKGDLRIKREIFGSIFSEKIFFDKNNC